MSLVLEYNPECLLSSMAKDNHICLFLSTLFTRLASFPSPKYINTSSPPGPCIFCSICLEYFSCSYLHAGSLLAIGLQLASYPQRFSEWSLNYLNFIILRISFTVSTTSVRIWCHPTAPPCHPEYKASEGRDQVFFLTECIFT